MDSMLRKNVNSDLSVLSALELKDLTSSLFRTELKQVSL